MKPYELVLVCDPKLSQKQLDELVGEVEGLFSVKPKEKEDMGLQKFHYNMKDKKYLNQGFVYSYHLELEPESVETIKKELSYRKTVVRHAFFAMKPTQEFFTMKGLEKKLKPLLESDERVMKKKKMSFFEGRENDKYFVWKALPLLLKFTTRFGDIKPRKYTGLSVQQQKKVRAAIIRARELGMLPYIK